MTWKRLIDKLQRKRWGHKVQPPFLKAPETPGNSLHILCLYPAQPANYRRDPWRCDPGGDGPLRVHNEVRRAHRHVLTRT